jgi:hypothetical protein
MALVPFLFFSFSGAKLVHYVLPCVIPLALLVGDRLSFLWSEDGVELRPRKLFGSAIGCIAMSALANVGFGAWYTMSGHAEVHGLAKMVPRGENVSAYQMPRRQRDRGTGRAKIQETSHPSLAFYLDRVLLEAESPQELAKAPMPLYVITRNNRLSQADFALLRGSGLNVSRLTKDARSRYQLFLLTSKVGVSSVATHP